MSQKEQYKTDWINYCEKLKSLSMFIDKTKCEEKEFTKEFDITLRKLNLLKENVIDLLNKN